MQQKEKRKERMKREEFMRKATDIWLTDIIPNFEERTAEKRTRKLWRQGLPPRVRGQVWQLAAGNSLHISEDLFEILCDKKTPVHNERVESSDDMEKLDRINRDSGNINLIKIDLSRTFPALQFFQEGGPYYDNFQKVLECYAKFRPDVGYVQGMSYLVAMLLLNMETYPAFVTLANMLNRNHFYSFFKMNMDEIEKCVQLFKILMNEELPLLFKHFEKEGVNHQTFIVDWFITLFAKSLPLDIAARLWDIYFLEGDLFLYRATLGLLKYFENKLIKSEFETIMSFLSRLNQVVDFDESQLFDRIDEVVITKNRLEKCKELASIQVLQKKKRSGGKSVFLAYINVHFKI
ncbi:TBC1 domain family protein [Acrasis kona]